MKQILRIPFLFALLALVACQPEDEGNTSPQRLPLRVEATAMDFGSNATPRTVDVPGGTRFVPGDRMGLFAVKNNAIYGNIENLELVYTGDGNWMEKGGQLFYDPSGGVTYYAYSPYKEGVSFDATKTLDENVAAWTATGGKFALSTDQSTKEKYIAADLMTASATPTSALLELTFEHRMAQLTLSFTGKYAPPSGVKYSYWLPGTLSDVKVNDTSACLSENGLTYRIVVPPVIGSQTLKGAATYTNTEGGTFSLSTQATVATGFGAKKSYTLKIRQDPAVSPTVRPVEVGDFYYQNATIIPKDDPAPTSEGCIGIVAALGTETWKGKAMPEGYTDGIVVALQDATTPEDNSFFTLREARETMLDYYETQHPTPPYNSNWYLPEAYLQAFICSGRSDIALEVTTTFKSIGKERKNLLSTQLAKVSGTDYAVGKYRTGVISNGHWYFVVNYDNGTQAGGHSDDANAFAYYTRYCFAF